MKQRFERSYIVPTDTKRQPMSCSEWAGWPWTRGIGAPGFGSHPTG